MNKFWGVVEDRIDPMKLGRVKVRILGVHTSDLIQSDITGIPTSDLQWAYVVQPTTSPAVNGLGENPFMVEGTHVTGFFRDNMMQAPVVDGTIPGIPEEPANPKKGFNDPNGKYPKESHLNESDINRLARNEKISETIVQTKKDGIEEDVASAAGSIWSEPATPYAAVYPFNHVKETECGHIEEFDDTEGAERLNRHHKAGTFEEIHPDGTRVQKIVGDDFEIVAKGKNVLIKGTCNITVLSTCNLKALLANVDIPTTNWVGDINQTGNLNQDGDTTSTGTVTAPTVDASTSLKAATKEIVGHSHPAGTPPGNTGTNN